ncbi:MAG: terminase family protein [Synergistaceae bacterium]|nr:terminase family protein [Synergistaceae bacterium]
MAIYGGAPDGGKTYALLLEPLRLMNVEGYSAAIFRKNATQITIDGGLFYESTQIYGLLRNALYKASPKPHWTFSGKTKESLMHIDGDRDIPKRQGSQICFPGFDELCHLEKPSACGVKSYVRAACNPNSDSWEAKFVLNNAD